jgi:hypothetical protein
MVPSAPMCWVRMYANAPRPLLDSHVPTAPQSRRCHPPHPEFPYYSLVVLSPLICLWGAAVDLSCTYSQVAATEGRAPLTAPVRCTADCMSTASGTSKWDSTA